MTEPVISDLEWLGDLRFSAQSAATQLILDSGGRAGPSPVQALAFSLAGCMAIDVVHILEKGRFVIKGLTAHLVGERASEEPRRLVKVTLHFAITGDVPGERVERALALSRERYCSVWHSLRQDLDFRTSFEVREPSGNP